MLLLEAGRTVIFSNPDACPDMFIPNVYTLPLMDMEVGVVDPRVALPPEIANTKSSFSSAPLPPVVRYTGSFIVTAIVLLLLAICTDETLGSIVAAVCA